MPRNSAKERAEMTIIYKISIPEPHTHYVKVSMQLERPKGAKNIRLFMPAWSPGSYLVREYSRHIRGLRCFDEKGSRLFVEQSDKNHYFVDFAHPEFKSECKKFEVEYEIYCNELTVRTAHVDTTHAFLHGPAIFLGVCDIEMTDLEVHLDFPPLWSHVSTTLKDISTMAPRTLMNCLIVRLKLAAKKPMALCLIKKSIGGFIGVRFLQ